MSKKILIIIGALILLISIPLTIFLVKQRQELRMKAAPATILSLTPATLTKAVAETFTVNIVVNTGENSIVSADIDLSFDPTVLEALSISAGSFFESPTEPTRLINNTTGKINYSLFTLTAKQGSGTLATITFKGKAAGVSQVAFDPTTTVGGIGETEALSRTEPGSYVIASAATPTPTPTTGPTITPTQTPTPSPTSVLTMTPTPTPTSGTGGLGPTAISTPTPTPTTVVRTTPTPTPTTSPEELPETGNITPTFILIGFGILVLTSGLLLLF